MREKNNVISELQKEVEKCTKDVEQTLKVSLSVHPIGLFAFACLFIHCWAIHSFIHPSISFNRILSYPIPFHPTPFHPILFHPILFHPILFHPILAYSCNLLPIHPYTCPPVRLIIYPIQVFIPSNYLSHPIIYSIQLFIPSIYSTNHKSLINSLTSIVRAIKFHRWNWIMPKPNLSMLSERCNLEKAS